MWLTGTGATVEDRPPQSVRTWLAVAGNSRFCRLMFSATPDKDVRAAATKFTASAGAKAMVLDGLYDGERMHAGMAMIWERERLAGNMYEVAIGDVIRAVDHLAALEWREVPTA